MRKERRRQRKRQSLGTNEIIYSHEDLVPPSSAEAEQDTGTFTNLQQEQQSKLKQPLPPVKDQYSSEDSKTEERLETRSAAVTPLGPASPRSSSSPTKMTKRREAENDCLDGAEKRAKTTTLDDVKDTLITRKQAAFATGPKSPDLDRRARPPSNIGVRPSALEAPLPVSDSVARMVAAQESTLQGSSLEEDDTTFLDLNYDTKELAAAIRENLRISADQGPS